MGYCLLYPGGCPMSIVYYTQERDDQWDIFYYTQEGGCPMSLFIISKSRDA